METGLKRCKIRSRKPSEKISAVIQETDGSGPAWDGDSGNGEKKTECQDRGRSDSPQCLLALGREEEGRAQDDSEVPVLGSLVNGGVVG